MYNITGLRSYHHHPIVVSPSCKAEVIRAVLLDVAARIRPGARESRGQNARVRLDRGRADAPGWFRP
eukprot:570008-Prorocentrum_minimum.AAC.1